MKRLAVIAPDFAPSSMPPAMCIRFMVSDLSSYGWHPTIITTDPKYYEHVSDPENLSLVSAELDVVRVGALPARLTRKIGFSDLGIRSFWHYWHALSQLNDRRKLDALLINMPPFVPMLIGRLAHMRYKVPYILNYTDPWRTDYFRSIPKQQRPGKWRLAELLSETIEPFAIRNAAALIGVSRATTDMVIANYPSYERERTHEILCGGEAADIAFVREHPRPNPVFDPHDGLIHISSTGHFNPMLRHAADALFQAVQLGLTSEPELFSRLRLHFVGTSYAANASQTFQVLPIAQNHNISHFVTEHPQRLSYLDTLQIMVDSHGLIMLGNESPHYTASKLFPYILSKRQILALFHEHSSVVRILSETQAGVSITFSVDRPLSRQTEAIREELRVLLERPPNWQPPTLWNTFEKYTATAMAQKLADVLDKAVRYAS